MRGVTRATASRLSASIGRASPTPRTAKVRVIGGRPRFLPNPEPLEPLHELQRTSVTMVPLSCNQMQ